MSFCVVIVMLKISFIPRKHVNVSGHCFMVIFLRNKQVINDHVDSNFAIGINQSCHTTT